MNCRHCGKECKNANSHSNHERCCPANLGRVYKNNKTGRAGGNQFTTGKVTKMSDEAIDKIRQANLGKKWSEERKLQHSLTMKQAVLDNPDSYSKNNVSGRVKLVEYNGIRLKGSWELKVAKWLDENNISWETEVNPQPYIWNNSWHLYFPDFFLKEQDVYIEVKGYKTERDVQKWTQFSGELIVVDSKSIDNLDEFLGRTHKLVSAPCS